MLYYVQLVDCTHVYYNWYDDCDKQNYNDRASSSKPQGEHAVEFFTNPLKSARGDLILIWFLDELVFWKSGCLTSNTKVEQRDQMTDNLFGIWYI